MKKYFTIIFLFSLGCASTITENVKSALSRYETVVFDDGVSLEEAKVIAQRELINRNFVRIYDLSDPQEARNVSRLPRHQDYWFIYFKERKGGSIAFVFTVIIDRRNGQIKYGDDHARGNTWILEAALLR